MSHSSQLIETDIEAYLKHQENKGLVKCLTCGSVDDGKSTLIGRLLHDAEMILEDQLKAITRDSKRVGTTGEAPDLALLVDGLQSEREQGITIDVAYRYFSTDKRKFILADCPGHEQYTRNMATGASNCDVAIILVDARKGVLTQTRRHAYICALLGIKHLIVAVNKMDLVGYDGDIFTQVRDDFSRFAQTLGLKDVEYVPISALVGDNVVHQSELMTWYQGEPLMAMLHSRHIVDDADARPLRFQVQYVNRPDADFRGYAGTIASGRIAKGDPIVVLPSGKTSHITAIVDFDGEMDCAGSGQAVTLTIADDIDIGRGDMIVAPNALPISAAELEADVVWMHEQALEPGREYVIKHGSKSTSAMLCDIQYAVDINTLEHHSAKTLGLNGIGRCRFICAEPLHCDTFVDNSGTGAFIIIDRLTNVTVGAAMIVASVQAQSAQAAGPFSEFELELNALIRKRYPHWEAKDISLWGKKPQ